MLIKYNENFIKKKPIKYLNFGLKKKTGKNFLGYKAVKSKGFGRSKRKYRIIDFYRENYNVNAIILKIEYDPNRSANIALICYKNGFLSYIIAPSGLKKSDIIDQQINSIGVVKQLFNFKFGTFVHCLENKINYGFKIARSAGCYCVILNTYLNNKIIVRYPSGEEKLIYKNNKAVLGIVSNENLKYNKLKKAGNNIWLGKKPIVRGVAKNAVDHPNGGGRGKTSKWSISSNFTKRVLKGVPLKKKKDLNLLKKKTK